MIKKILVPLDGSELSSSVLSFVVDLAKPLEASVILFHAVVPPVLTYPGAEGIGFDARVLEEMESGAQNFLSSAAGDLAAKGVPTDILVTVGNATDGIVAAADSEGVDLIVMSTHGRSGIGRLVLGSVADALVRRSRRPVVLVRPQQPEEDGGAR